MTLKIEKHSDGYSTIIRLIGRMRAEHLSELRKQIEESESKITLDLEEVNLVDVEAVRFLGMCEAQGVTLSTARLTYEIGSAKSGIKGIGENQCPGN